MRATTEFSYTVYRSNDSTDAYSVEVAVVPGTADTDDFGDTLASMEHVAVVDLHLADSHICDLADLFEDWCLSVDRQEDFMVS